MGRPAETRREHDEDSDTFEIFDLDKKDTQTIERHRRIKRERKLDRPADPKVPQGLEKPTNRLNFMIVTNISWITLRLLLFFASS